MLAEPDPYKRPQPDYLDAVIVNSDTEEWRSYKIKQLLDKHQRKYGRKSVTEYLIQ